MVNESGGRVGPKQAVTAEQAVCASQHTIVTDTMLEVMRDGGNAIDAAIAGCIVQAVVQQDMTNHTGTVMALVYEAATGQVHELNSSGTIVPGLPPLAPVPAGKGLYARAPGSPIAVIPGFMPGMKALFERFATKPWDYLCAPALHWAEEGHVVDSFEHLVMAQTVDFFLYTASGRAHFTADGHLPQVGDRWRRPVLATTMRRLAEEGPDYFITGEWATKFIARANELGWNIKPEHMTAIPPRWGEGFRWQHRGHDIVQLGPPERQGVFCAMVLGILEELDITSVGHWSSSAEGLYYLAHALRRAAHDTGFLNDPQVFGDPSAAMTDRAYLRLAASIMRDSQPSSDMTQHVELKRGKNALAAAGLPAKQPSGSCELSLVDAQGNWVQMMNTLQSGGIPGEVVEGIPMVGSHAVTDMNAAIAGWHAGGGRVRSVIGNTLVLKDGKPVLSMGSPGNVHCTVPQVLSGVLDFGLDPYDAEDAPRCMPFGDDYTIQVESRVPAALVADLAKMGVLVDPLPSYDYHMGSFQMSWRDDDGTLHGCAGPRRAGKAAGF